MKSTRDAGLAPEQFGGVPTIAALTVITSVPGTARIISGETVPWSESPGDQARPRPAQEDERPEAMPGACERERDEREPSQHVPPTPVAQRDRREHEPNRRLAQEAADLEELEAVGDAHQRR